MTDRDNKPLTDAPAADTVQAEDLLQRRKAVFGKLYIVSLKDIYEMIGEHSARIEDAVRLMCQHAIERHVGDADPVTLEIAGAFLFRFHEKSDAEGWEKAKVIVDEIGAGALGARYKPDRHHPMIRLAVAAPEHVLDGEDRPEPEKVAGALDAVREVPRDHVLISWKARRIEHDSMADNEWLDLGARRHASLAGKIVEKVKSAWRKRQAERRKHRLPWGHRERRHGLERRGRGY